MQSAALCSEADGPESRLTARRRCGRGDAGARSGSAPPMALSSSDIHCERNRGDGLSQLRSSPSPDRRDREQRDGMAAAGTHCMSAHCSVQCITACLCRWGLLAGHGRCCGIAAAIRLLPQWRAAVGAAMRCDDQPAPWDRVSSGHPSIQPSIGPAAVIRSSSCLSCVCCESIRHAHACCCD